MTEEGRHTGGEVLWQGGWEAHWQGGRRTGREVLWWDALGRQTVGKIMQSYWSFGMGTGQSVRSQAEKPDLR